MLALDARFVFYWIPSETGGSAQRTRLRYGDGARAIIARILIPRDRLSGGYR